MQSGPASVALVFTGFAVLVAGIWAWTLVAAKAVVAWRLVPELLAAVISRFLVSQGLTPRLPLIAWSPRRAVPWAFLDLVVLTGLYIVAGAALHESGLIASGKMETLTLVQKQNVIAANLVLSLGIAAASIALTMVRCGASGSDLGWSSRMIGNDLRLGVIAFVMLAPACVCDTGRARQILEEKRASDYRDVQGRAGRGVFWLVVRFGGGGCAAV